MAENIPETNHLELATELTIAWLSNPNTRASAEEVPSFLEQMHVAVANLSSAAAKAGAQEEAAQPEYTPAVSSRKSLSSKDHIISMIDGKPYKTLRRHLARHGLTPEQYRERYGLRSDYPMVAENYAEVRRNLAKKIGLGRKPRGAAATTPSTESAGKNAVVAEGAAQPPAGGRRKARAAAPKTAAKEAGKAASAKARAPKAPGRKSAGAKGGAKPAAKKETPARKNGRAGKSVIAANDAGGTPASEGTKAP